MPPRVSILLPARDAAATLPACLCSIQRQTFADFRCVLVDDGSRDDTLAIARATAATDARFFVVAAPRRGIVATPMAGLPHCDGEFTARMDADDVMHRDRLCLQVDALTANPQLAGVAARARLFPGPQIGDGMRAYARWHQTITTPDEVRAARFIECPVVNPTLMLRTDVLRAFGYRDMGWAEDYDLVLRLLAAGHDLAVLPRTLLGWRQGPTTATRTDPRFAAERFPELKAAFLADGLLHDHDRYVLWGFGRTGRMLHKALLAHDKRAACIVELHPRRLGKTIHGARVIPPAELPHTMPLPVLVSVAGESNRAIIRPQLTAMGRVDGRDYVFTA